MAHTAKIGALTDELIQAIVNFDPASNRKAYRHAKDIASRELRGHQYARTNPFDVTARLAGLDEKFRIKNRDDLADALQARLQKLEGVTSKFKPDYLSLLLLLADRPLENAQVEALELLRPPSPPPILTWAEILAEDPYSDEELWKDIDYTGDSSGDEKPLKKRRGSRPKPATSIDEDDTYDPEAYVLENEISAIKQLADLQFWNAIPDEDGSKNNISELDIIRETLYMLAGLRTSLYQIEVHQYNIRINPAYTLSHAMPATVERLLSQFTNIGKEVNRLRQWAEKTSFSPLTQTFEAAVRKRLLEFDRVLSQLHQRYLLPNAPISVSLLALHNECRSMSITILRLAQLVLDVEPRLLINPFSHLEALFDHITLAQVTLEKDVFKYMSEIFFECLQTYLKPMRRWMEIGELGTDDEIFFVFANDSSSDPASLWHDRYVLRHNGQDTLRSPKFLQPAVKKIFNTGKSVVFLQMLGIQETDWRDFNQEPRLDYETVCGRLEEVPLSPFPDLFQAAFEVWIRSKYSVASNILRQHIFNTGGLMHILSTFEFLYFGKNGAVFEEFSNSVFERMDAGRRGWNDRYVLTDLARSTFSIILPSLDTERVVVRSSKTKSQDNSVKALSAISIDFAVPWSIQNIIQRSALPIYQQLSTFLLQIYRVQYLLLRVRPTRLETLRHSRSAHAIRLQHRLTWFTNILRSYLTETVIFFTTHDMTTAMEKAQDIDDMSQIHVKYVAKLQERALLSKAITPIYNAVIAMLDLGVSFAHAIKAATDAQSNQNKSSATTDQKHGNPVDAIPLRLLRDADSDPSDDVPASLDTPKNQEILRHRNTSTLHTKLHTIDTEFTRLLPFITAGLRSVGRVGAEPMWEQLSERLELETVKSRFSQNG